MFRNIGRFSEYLIQNIRLIGQGPEMFLTIVGSDYDGSWRDIICILARMTKGKRKDINFMKNQYGIYLVGEIGSKTYNN